MKTLIVLIFISVTCFAGDDKIVRDANGKIIATIDQTATSKIVRDVAGKVIETRQLSDRATIVRDSSGKVIRTEDKARK